MSCLTYIITLYYECELHESTQQGFEIITECLWDTDCVTLCYHPPNYRIHFICDAMRCV